MYAVKSKIWPELCRKTSVTAGEKLVTVSFLALDGDTQLDVCVSLQRLRKMYVTNQ